MAFWAYILHCRGGVFYTGHTDNLPRRIAEHESGMIAGFTADKLPVVLVWSQEFSTRFEALEAERRIKGWIRAKKMALIRGDWDKIAALARSKNGPSTSSGQTDEE
jgi:putative endonuclease